MFSTSSFWLSLIRICVRLQTGDTDLDRGRRLEIVQLQGFTTSHDANNFEYIYVLIYIYLSHTNICYGGELVPPWDVLAVIGDSRQLGMEMGVEFAWARRTANEVAHVVAGLASIVSLPANWVATPPACFLPILARESVSL